MSRRISCFLGSTLTLAGVSSPLVAQAPTAQDDQLKDLLELLNTPIVSASKNAERLSEAPATVIVLQRIDLLKRGYTEVSQILSDLPGMQVSRPYGDSQFKNYWRGYRTLIGEPFLFMVDGIVQNSLFFNAAEGPMTVVPMSNIDRIEVVYGPASSVYGPNAFMGVINVITRKQAADGSGGGWAKLGAGSNALRFADATYSLASGDFTLSATFRLEDSIMDPSTSEGYEFTKSKYLQDRRLWGVFIDNPSIAGQNNSANIKRAMDIRATWGKLELGYQRYDLRSGYGNEYAFDYTQNAELWHRRETSFHLRHSQNFTDALSGSTLLRYRESDIPGDSTYLDAGPYAAGGAWGAAYSYWATLNNSVSFFQDFTWKASNSLSMNFGLKYERKDVQKAYDNPYGDYQASTVTTAYHFPTPPSTSLQPWNRVLAEDRGLYLQAKWRVDDHNSLILGGRSDYNNAYKSANTLRAGYVGNFDRLSVKAMFGQAFQEPVPRNLYAGWAGSGSSTSLQPEKSDTTEVSVGYTGSSASILGSLWNVKDKAAILGSSQGAKNLGDRTLRGLDVHLQAQTLMPALGRLKAWAYLSFLLHNSGTNNPDPGTGKVTLEGLTKDGGVGDLSKLTTQFGVTWEITYEHSITLLGRHVGSRDTVSTNPVGSVAAYTTADLVYHASRLFGTDLGLTVKCSNLTDKAYFHPGVNTAGAGSTPADFNGQGQWSRVLANNYDYYSSLLAQPGREVQVALSMRF